MNVKKKSPIWLFCLLAALLCLLCACKDTAQPVNAPEDETATVSMVSHRFSITNAAGETLECDGAVFSGTMQILEQKLIPNGDNYPAGLLLTVKQSDSFTYTNLSGSDADVCVTAGNGFASVTGAGITGVKLDLANKALTVSGERLSYTAWLKVGIPGYEYFYLKGTNAAAFSIAAEGETVATHGLTGQQTCGFADVDSPQANTASLTFGEESRLDLSKLSETGKLQFSTESALPASSFTRKDDLE